MCIALLHSYCEPRTKDVVGQLCLKTWHETHWDIAWACSDWRAWLQNSFTWLISGHGWKQGVGVTFHMCSWLSFLPWHLFLLQKAFWRNTREIHCPLWLVWEVIKGHSWLNLESMERCNYQYTEVLRNHAGGLWLLMWPPSVDRECCCRINSRNAWS